jgi:hypothetical protein
MPGILSDIFDGIIARNLNVSTAIFSRPDSIIYPAERTRDHILQLHLLPAFLCIPTVY